MNYESEIEEEVIGTYIESLSPFFERRGQSVGLNYTM